MAPLRPGEQLLTLVDLVRQLQPRFYGTGMRVGENSAFGPAPKPGVHSAGGYHYKDGGAGSGSGAVDWRDWRADRAPEHQGGSPLDWRTRTANLAGRFKQLATARGLPIEVFGPGDRGHDTHVHTGYTGKIGFIPAELDWLATGRGDPGFRPAGRALAAAAGPGAGAGAAPPSNSARWLNVLRVAEGTDGPNAYTTMFGGGQFKDLSRHPDQVNRAGGYASAAAGAYQFMPKTWESASKALGLKDFSPANQDKAALWLIKQRGIDPDTAAFTRENVAKLAPEWASLPTLKGTSYYNQPVKAFGELEKVWSATKPAGGSAAAQGGGSGGSGATKPSPSPGTAALSIEQPQMSRLLTGSNPGGGGGATVAAVKPEYGPTSDTVGMVQQLLASGGRSLSSPQPAAAASSSQVPSPDFGLNDRFSTPRLGPAVQSAPPSRSALRKLLQRSGLAG